MLKRFLKKIKIILVDKLEKFITFIEDDFQDITLFITIFLSSTFFIATLQYIWVLELQINCLYEQNLQLMIQNDKLAILIVEQAKNVEPVETVQPSIVTDFFFANLISFLISKMILGNDFMITYSKHPFNITEFGPILITSTLLAQYYCSLVAFFWGIEINPLTPSSQKPKADDKVCPTNETTSDQNLIDNPWDF